MALNSGIEWDVRTTGADTNGGGFKAGASGIDWTQQNAAQYSVTDAVTAGTTTITSASANFGTDVVGNVLYIQGGTGGIAAGWYEITARASTTSITVDRSTGLTAGTGATLKIGGALLTLSTVEPIAVAGNTIHVKDGAGTNYGETLTLTISGSGGTARRWIGYASTHGDNPTGSTRPIIDGAATRANCIDVNTRTSNTFENFIFEDATGANVTVSTGAVRFLRCLSRNAGTDGWAMTGNGALRLAECEGSGNAGKDVNSSSTGAAQSHGCYWHDSASNSVLAAGTGSRLTWCISDSPGATAISAGNSFDIESCTIYNASGGTSDGVAYTASNGNFGHIRNCIIANNGRYGINKVSTANGNIFGDYNNLYSNGTSAYNNISAGAADITTDPGFTNAASGDFSVGTNPKAAGYPGLFPGGLSTGYLDIGAVQRQEPAGGSGLARIIGG